MSSGTVRLREAITTREERGRGGLDIPTRHVLRESGKDTLHIYAHCRARGFTWIPVWWNSVRGPRRNNGDLPQETVDGTTRPTCGTTRIAGKSLRPRRLTNRGWGPPD